MANLRVGQEKIIVVRNATGSDQKLRVGQVKVIVVAPYANFTATNTARCQVIICG